MPGFLVTVLRKTLSERTHAWQDPERLIGKKHVLIVLACDPSHPSFQEAAELYQNAADDLLAHEVELRFEDHPEGFLHARFQCGTEAFRSYLIDKKGNVLACGRQVIAPDEILEMIKRPDHQEFLIL